MAIATNLRTFLDANHLDYETVRHERTQSAGQSAAAAHVPGDKVAKAVVLKDEAGYLLAVLPSTHRVHLGRLHRTLDRRLGLATEGEAAGIFPDCAIGAIPAAGLLYDVDTMVDDALLQQTDVYFEAGDHQQLIHMNRREFGRLLGDATHSRFSYHV